MKQIPLINLYPSPYTTLHNILCIKHIYILLNDSTSDSHLSLQCPTDPTAGLLQSTRFLPFSETIQLAARYDLPLVGYVRASHCGWWWLVGWLSQGRDKKSGGCQDNMTPIFNFCFEHIFRFLKRFETNNCQYLPT